MFSINSFLSKAAVAAALLFPVQAAAQCVIDKPAYMLYTDEGMPSSFGDMIEAMAQSDVIFFGEYHNSSVVHWLERVVFTSLADRLDNKLTLGSYHGSYHSYLVSCFIVVCLRLCVCFGNSFLFPFTC